MLPPGGTSLAFRRQRDVDSVAATARSIDNRKDFLTAKSRGQPARQQDVNLQLADIYAGTGGCFKHRECIAEPASHYAIYEPLLVRQIDQRQPNIRTVGAVQIAGQLV